MEEDHNTDSPLASFPNEHPINPQHATAPFYRSRIFIFSCVALVLIATGIAAGTMLLGKKQDMPEKKMPKQSPPPTITTTQSTSAAITANWNIYPNATYAYEIKYDKDATPKEMNTTTYGYTEFSDGCMKVYAVPTTIVSTLSEEKNGIPWKQLNALKSMPVGQNRNCSVLTFTFGEDGKAIVDRNDYTKQAPEKIADADWYTFAVKNGLSASVSAHMVYFTEKNNNTYVIETKTGGICPTTPKDMLSTFSFIK